MSKKKLKYTFEEYINYDPFDGDKESCEIRLRSVKIVKTRKPHLCIGTGKQHVIEPGTMARFERALFDGEFCSWYCCTSCIDKYFCVLLDDWE